GASTNTAALGASSSGPSERGKASLDGACAGADCSSCGGISTTAAALGASSFGPSERGKASLDGACAGADCSSCGGISTTAAVLGASGSSEASLANDKGRGASGCCCGSCLAGA